MKMTHRILGLTALAALALSSQVCAQGPVVIERTQIVSPAYVPVERVVSRTYVRPTTYAPLVYAPAPRATLLPRRQFVTTTTVLPTTTTTYLPTTTNVIETTTVTPQRTYVVDPALTPVGYEVVRPGRTRVVYPRRVVRYVY